MNGPQHTFWDDIPSGLKQLLDLVSFTALLGTLLEMLPHIAAILTIIWTAIPGVDRLLAIPPENQRTTNTYPMPAYKAVASTLPD